MKRARTGSFVVIGLGVAAFIGCAVGTNHDASSGETNFTNLAAEAGDDNAVRLPPSNERDAGVAESAAPSPDAGANEDAGPDGGGDAGVASCTSLNNCGAATDLGSVSGDTGADTKTAQGTGSEWLKVRVSESDSGLFGARMHAKVELQSPTGTNFDVFVYVAGKPMGQECSAVTASSTSTGGFDSASMSWGESDGGFSNGSDDSRTVTVEVRHVSGTCAPDAKWTLTVRGNSP